MKKPYADGKEHHPDIIKRIEASTRSERVGEKTIYRVDALHPRAPREVKILHISDTHFRGELKGEELRPLSKHLKEKFDLVLLTGDILDHYYDTWSEAELAFLKGLKARHGKFAVLGNHDYGRVRLPERTRRFLKLAGFKELTNRSVRVAGIRLVGLDDPLGGRPDARAAFRGVKKEEFVILITHSLDALDARTPQSDIVLSGHLHAGECRLLGLDSVDWLILRGHFKNVNKHKGPSPWKFLTERTLSHLSPGFNATSRQYYNIPRFGTLREGVSILTLRKHP